MDRQPQRLRAPSRLRDENMPPANVDQQKTLHHSRNKSTPALLSLLKNPAKTMSTTVASNNTQQQQPGKKRSAFADVSNTSRLTQAAAKDDLAIVKDGYGGIGHAIKVSHYPLKDTTTTWNASGQLQSNKPAPLRPAQRPLNAWPQREASSKQPSSTRAVASDAHSKAQNELGMTAVVKKRTTVFRETATTNSEPASLEQADTLINQPTGAPKDKDSSSSSDPTLSSVQEQCAESNYEFSKDLIATFDERFAASEVGLMPRPAETSSTAVESRTSSSQTITQVVPAPRSSDRELFVPALEDQAQPVEASVAAVKVTLSSHSDLPEYLDEDEEDYYDAEGYATTRSIRSRGDNTTGALTTFVEPRVTARVIQELEAARCYVAATRTEDDIEDEDWDTSMVAQYSDDIFEYMHKLENKMRPNEHYMDTQNEIQWSMRGVLMDWMIQVHTRFGLLPETLFLCVNYIDRFLSCKVVSLAKLQLVGATALFIAAKYEEINCPSVQEIVYMVDNAYTADDILKAERFMLSMLNFELGWPGPMSFLRRVSKADEYDLDSRTMSKYFLEVMVMDERFVACPPSFAAAGAQCLSRLVLDKGEWTLAHTHYSQYTYWQLHDLVVKIVECCQNPRKHHAAVFEKYTEKKYKKCSLVAESRLTSASFKLPPRTPSRESLSATTPGKTWGSAMWRKF